MKLLYLILAAPFYLAATILLLAANALGWIGAELHNGGKDDQDQ